MKCVSIIGDFIGNACISVLVMMALFIIEPVKGEELLSDLNIRAWLFFVIGCFSIHGMILGWRLSNLR